MYGEHNPYRPHGGGAPPPPPQYQNPINPYFQNPINHPYFQNPNNLFINYPANPNFQFHHPQNPNTLIPPSVNFQTPIQQQQQHQQQQRSSSSQLSPNISLAKVDRAVVKVRCKLIADGEHVSAWKVLQSVVTRLKAESWESLGFPMQQVPSLHSLILTEGKINAYIHCFVAVQRITSLHDLDVAICKNEGVGRYEELELGPLVRHPLVMHYFSLRSDAKDIFKITSEEIISCLCEFIDFHKGSGIGIEEFLDFVAKKKSVSGREKLDIRIQSLGKHLSIIRQATRFGNDTLKKCIQGFKESSGKRLKKRPLQSQQKTHLDEHFKSISERIESFASVHKDFAGKHIRFVSSSSEEIDSEESEGEVSKNGEDPNSHCGIMPQSAGMSTQPSRCPYPSAAEERSRLRLKPDIESNPSLSNYTIADRETSGLSKRKRKRKGDVEIDGLSASDDLGYKESHGISEQERQPENISHNITTQCKVPRTDVNRLNTYKNKFTSQFEADDFSLDDNSTKLFIMMWKEACRVNSVSEVFRRMLELYEVKRRRKRPEEWFASHPFIGLLNVAVKSITRGMWDSMYDDFQVFADQGVADIAPEECTLYESIEVEPAEKEAMVTMEYDSKCVSVEDIVQKISAYFEIDHEMLSKVELTLKSKFTFLRKLCKCEFWLAKEFSVKKFKSLGYGDFFIFLEKHVFILYDSLLNCLAGETFEKSSLEVCMLEKQVALFLSQAANSLGEGKNITKEMISPLLARQFPLVSFLLAERCFPNDFMDDVKKKGNILTCILFSTTLVGSHKGDKLSEEGTSRNAVGEDTGYESKTFGSVCTKDATEVLLRAPMLLDLLSWTHWDIVFEPSLGPLVGWLLNEVNMKELLCLVTKDGKVIRIDHTASVDSFFEACLQGSSFQTAVELLSILSLYGGEAHVPSSLLKCHARQALEVLMKNSGETDSSENKPTVLPGNSLYEHILGSDSSRFGFGLHKSNNTDRKDVKVASRFFIDCLGHLPREFHAFAADILLYGLQAILKDAPSVILGECKQINHRLLLHDVGLSLGIVEWIDDYHSFASSLTNENDSLISSDTTYLGVISSDSCKESICKQDELCLLPSAEKKLLVSVELNHQNKGFINEECKRVFGSLDEEVSSGHTHTNELDKEKEALMVIESIRREEFGLDLGLADMEASMLKKQHARLGRALHCLSQELYSQDSHFLLELVQNADDNVYPKNVEPTLTFILQESGIVVLNNEQGFSSQNIRALCDVGSSTKKGASSGYIGKKGIGFKSVFRVTDAPEIHSNGFHVKFDITEGQIGFVLPTLVPPCDIDFYRKLASCDTNNTDSFYWNTCIALPFRKKLSEDSSINNIRLMFCDLHPSLLLFLHRLQCIRFRSIPDNSFVIMRKEIVGNGIVNVSMGKEKMTWFVASQVLQADVIRPDVRTTEIAVAFTLQELGNGEYAPHLKQQPVFAFLPLRRYGLKFIIQGDFVLPSSREEVDGDSPWNQWLLTKFPDLFISAEKSFCAFPCFRDNPGKAVSFFMSFVPLAGEVQGFFSSLPRLIITKLRLSKCLLMEGDKAEWVSPCKVIRNWNDEAHDILLGSYLPEHLGLGLLDRNIVLSDSLARDLGIQEYGPGVLIQVMTSLCHSEKGIKSAGLVWLSSLLNALYTMLFNSSGQISLGSETALDVINNLKKIPFIPLSDGACSSVDEGTIWLHLDSFSPEFGKDHHPDVFPALYAKLRTVSPALFSATATVGISGAGMPIVGNVARMLLKIGVQQLSAHEIVKMHILPAICDDRITLDDKVMMVEYLSFLMFHLQSNCPNCHVERGHIMSDLCERAFISTNYGYRRPSEVTIHFSKQYGNPIDVNKLIDGMDLIWHEVDACYLQHPITRSLSSGSRQWREFFEQLGITDFIRVIPVEKSITDSSNSDLKNMLWDGERIPHSVMVKDWESQELVHLLSQLSISKEWMRSQYLLEAFDMLWEDCYSDKVAGYCMFDSAEDSRNFKSSFINRLCGIRWVSSSRDGELNTAGDLFYDCEAVRSVLGSFAQYAVPKVKSAKLLSDIGFKTQVNIDDVLAVLRVWRRSETPFTASVAQMSRLYTFVWNEMATSKQKIIDELHMGPFIFIPYSFGLKHDDIVTGGLFSPSEVHWHDFPGSLKQIKEIHYHRGSATIVRPLCKSLSNFYPSFHAFFVNECGVSETPHHRSYLQNLLELSTVALPSQTAKTVFQVFLQWSDGLKSGLLTAEDIIYLKECLRKLEYAVLPTVLDKWVSLHPSFGLVCWCDDDKLKKEFKHVNDIDFLYFGELSIDEKELVHTKVSAVMQTLGIPSLSEVITREAIYHGLADCSFKTSLLNWALTYAQRYMYSVQHDRYIKLKQSGFEFLNQLRIVVVERLFSRNIIKESSIASRKQFQCECLLQGNFLYATEESDSHSLFMELSRLLFDGFTDLHLANFLHMITTMAESGSNEEQTEFFIINSQKIPKLPDTEPIWSLPSSSSMSNDAKLPDTLDTANVVGQTSMNTKLKAGTSSNWPPMDWKTAPGVRLSHVKGIKVQPVVPLPKVVNEHESAGTDCEIRSDINTNCNRDCGSTAVTAVVVLPDSQSSKDQDNVVDLVDPDTESLGPRSRSFFPNGVGHFFFQASSNPEALLTGKLGEHVAYNYFLANAGKNIVTWVNQDQESGLPYDLVIEDKRKRQEYVEVKATKSSKKDWFHITFREWQFAVEKGEAFTIAHVILSGNDGMAKITVFKNPIRLCQMGKLQLAVVMPKQLEEFAITS